MDSMSVTYFRKTLSVAIRSLTVVQACRTVAWSLPPISWPIVASEQLEYIMHIVMKN